MLAGLLLSLAAAAPPPSAEPWPALMGSGFLTLPDSRTLEPRRFRVGLGVDNRDRDPLGLDLLDYSVTGAVGITRKLELQGRYVFSRVAAMPEAPALPPPPVDLVVPRGTPAPTRPWYSLNSAVPYVNKRGTARFGYLVPGDLVLVAKRRVLEPGERRPGVAALASVTLPVTRDVADLQSGSGTGGIDFSLGGVAEWSLGSRTLALSLSYTRVGAPSLSDRLIEAGPSGSALATDLPLRLPGRVELGGGLRQRLSGRFALALESSTSFEVGGATVVLDRARPLDALGGVQARLKRFRLTAGLRYHGHALPSGAERTSSLGGSFVDLTDVPDAAALSYLDSLGLSSARQQLRPRTQRLAALPLAGGPPLPAGARVIPTTFRVRSEHQLGFVIGLGLSF